MKGLFSPDAARWVVVAALASISSATCSSSPARDAGAADGGPDATRQTGGAGGAAGIAGGQVAGSTGMAGGAAGGQVAGSTGMAGGAAGAGGAGGQISCTFGCPAGLYCNGNAVCEDPSKSLSGLRVELPCSGAHGSVDCPCPAMDMDTTTLNDTGTYTVDLHIHGVVEQKTYSGVTAVGAGPVDGGADPNLFSTGGTPASDSWNVFELKVIQGTSGLTQTYYFNGGGSGIDQVWPIDYQIELRGITSESTFTLTANSVDGSETFNRGADGAPVIVPGVPPAPDAFDGQFVQVDVEQIRPQE